MSGSCKLSSSHWTFFCFLCLRLLWYLRNKWAHLRMSNISLTAFSPRTFKTSHVLPICVFVEWGQTVLFWIGPSLSVFCPDQMWIIFSLGFDLVFRLWTFCYSTERLRHLQSLLFYKNITNNLLFLSFKLCVLLFPDVIAPALCPCMTWHHFIIFINYSYCLLNPPASQVWSHISMICCWIRLSECSRNVTNLELLLWITIE